MWICLLKVDLTSPEVYNVFFRKYFKTSQVTDFVTMIIKTLKRMLIIHYILLEISTFPKYLDEAITGVL